MKGRCHHEYCSAEPVFDVVDHGDGKSGPFNPARPVYEYRGVWGFCPTHHGEVLCKCRSTRNSEGARA